MDRYNDSKIDNLIDNGFHFNYKLYLQSALNLLRNNLINFAAYTAIFLLFSLLVSRLQSIAPVILMLVVGPFLAGMYSTIRKIDLGQNIKLLDFFQGFKNPAHTMFAYTLVNLIVLMGSFLLLIPGIYFAVAFTFVLPFVVFKNITVLSALETSRQIITKQWLEVFIFSLILGVLNVVGFLLWGLGVLISLPFSIIAIYFAYKDVIGFEQGKDKDDSGISMNYFR